MVASARVLSTWVTSVDGDVSTAGTSLSVETSPSAEDPDGNLESFS